MRKKLAIICAFTLTVMSSSSVYAEANVKEIPLSENLCNQEVVASTERHENVLEKELGTLEKKYDMTSNMPEEVIKELEPIADVSKEVQKLDEERIQVSYNIIPKTPTTKFRFTSGNTEELYSLTNYTYIMRANNTGSTTETSKLSDVTFKNTVNYSYYNNGTVRMLKITSGKTTITQFFEKGLRNLVLRALSQGFTSGGSKLEENSTTFRTPSLNTAYSFYSGFQYYYATNAAKIIYGAEVTYSHGESSYTVRANISLGS